MPLYKPKFLTPGGENKTTDLSNKEGVEFSCVVDGNVPVKKYQIDIWSMNNKAIHFSKSTTLTDYFFPINENNEYNLFQFSLSASELSNSQIVNSTIPYKWQISMWSAGNENNETPDTVSCEEVFYGNSSPNVVLKYKVGDSYNILNEDILSSKVLSFKCEYQQEQGVALQRYGWYIKNQTTGLVLYDTTDDGKMIYGSANNILLTYDGFLNNESYLVKCKITTQNNVEIDVQAQFSINYSTYNVTSDFTIETLPEESGNLLYWGNVRAIIGQAYNNIGEPISTDALTFESNYPTDGLEAITIENDKQVVFEKGTYDDLDLSENSTIVYSGQFDDGKDKVVLELEGFNDIGEFVSRVLEIKNNQFVYTVTQGSTESVKVSEEYVFTDTNWYIIVMYPIENEIAEMRITHKQTIDSLYPSSSLFAGSGLYAQFGTWEGEM